MNNAPYDLAERICVSGTVPVLDHIFNALNKEKLDPLPFLSSVFKGLHKKKRQQSPKIFCNGVIRPMINGDAHVTVAALAIKKGCVVKAGTLNECIEALPDAERVDLKGNTILPGFVEPHLHIITSAIMHTGVVDCSPFKEQQLVGKAYTLQYCYDRLKRALSEKGDISNGEDDEWLIGYGLDPSLFSDTERGKWSDPTATDLDANVTAESPILVINASGHVAYANKKALKLSGSSSTSGILLEKELFDVAGMAIKSVAQSDPLWFVFEFVRQIGLQLHNASSLGVTLVWDALLGVTQKRAELEFFNVLANSGVAPVRMGGGIAVGSVEVLKKWKYCECVTPKTYKSDLLRIPCVKLVSDGSNQGLTGFQRDPYPYPDSFINADHPNGIFNLEHTDYKKLMVEADRAGWSIMTHANGDEAIAKVLDGYKGVCEENAEAKTKRHRIEHCSLASQCDLERMREYGVSPSFLIGHVGYWGHAFSTKVFHPGKASRLDPVRSAQQKHLRFTLHSDYQVSPLGPLRMVEQAVTRIMEGDEKQRVLTPEERITMAQALRAITYDAAWQCHMDDLCGSLVEGKRADLVILETDPMTMERNAMGLRNTKIVQTWMDGRVMYDESE